MRLGFNWHGGCCVLKMTLTSADPRGNSILLVSWKIRYENQQLLLASGWSHSWKGSSLPMASFLMLGKPFASQASPSSVVTELAKLALLGRGVWEPRYWRHVTSKLLFLVPC